MRGSEVYDPDGASLTAVSFTERRYRIERGSNFSRGSLPIGGALSPESAFFNTLELPGYVRQDFSAFSRPGLELAGKILKAPDTVSPLFRAYLFLGVGRLMSSRPEKWLVDYCQFGEDLETIRSIAGAAMTGRKPSTGSMPASSLAGSPFPATSTTKVVSRHLGRSTWR